MRIAFSTRQLATAILFVGLFAMASRTSIDSDMFWHIRAGAWMVEHGRVLTVDVFSHTMAGQPWQYPAWLSEVAMYWLFSQWGYGALTLFTAFFVTVAFAFVYVSCEGGVYLKAWIIILAAAASAVFWAARPHIVTFAFSAITLYVLEQFRLQGRNRLWILPLLMTVWGNAHPGYSIGFILIGLTLAGETLKASFTASRQAWRGPLWLGSTGLVCALALLASPYGPSQFTFPFRTLSSSLLQNYIQEWQSPDFHLKETQVFIALLVALFGAVGAGGRRLDVTDGLLVGAFLYLALVAGRNIALFSIVAAPVIARHARAALDEWMQRNPRWRLVAAPTRVQSRTSTLLNGLLLALVLAAALLKIALPLDPALNQRLARSSLPVQAANFIAARQPSGNLFNSYNWGGYLSWALYPDYAIYVDGRTDLYGDEFFAEYLRVASGAPEWDSVLRARGVNLLLVEAGSPLANLARRHPGWVLRYADPVALVFVRAS